MKTQEEAKKKALKQELFLLDLKIAFSAIQYEMLAEYPFKIPMALKHIQIIRHIICLLLLTLANYR